MKRRCFVNLQALAWLALVLVIGLACDFVEDAAFEELSLPYSGQSSEPPEADDVPIRGAAFSASHGPASAVSLGEAIPLVILRQAETQAARPLHRSHPPPRFRSDPQFFETTSPLRI